MPRDSAFGYQGRMRIPVAAAPMEMVPFDTNLHTHGWHVDPDVDNVFKSLALAAELTCTYRFKIRADQPPGTYWYPRSPARTRPTDNRWEADWRAR